MPVYRRCGLKLRAVAVAVAVNAHDNDNDNDNDNAHVNERGDALAQRVQSRTAASISIPRKCAASFSNRMESRRLRLIFWKKHSTRKRSL